MVIGSRQHANLRLTLSGEQAGIPWSSRGLAWVAIGHHKVNHEDKPVDKSVDKSPNDR